MNKTSVTKCDINSFTIQTTGSLNINNDEEIGEKASVVFQMLDPIDSFSGREKELKQLETKLISKKLKKLVVVSGLAGFGKTALAVKFAWDKRKFFENNLVFINAESEASLRLSFGDLSAELKINMNGDLNIQSVIKKVFLHFKNRRCLFIFDNAVSYSSISSFLPTKFFLESTDIYIIVTSLVEGWGNCESFQLDALSTIGALKILNAIIKEYDFYSATLWEDLIDCLDRIPLAIQIVGALICNEIHKSKLLYNDNKFNLEKYIEGLRTEKIDVTLKRLPSNTDLSYTNTIYTAIKKSIVYLQTKNKHSLEILCVISYLNPDYITKEHLSKILYKIQDLDNCLQEMIKLSLIRINNSFNSIFIHRLVQKTLRNYQKEERISQKYINLIIHAILTDKQICYRHQNTVLQYLEENIDYCILFFDNNPNLREEYLLLLTQKDSHAILEAIFIENSKKFWSKINKNIATIIKKIDLLKIALQNFNVYTVQLLIPYYYNKSTGIPTAYALLAHHFQTDEKEVLKITDELIKLHQNNYNHNQQIKLLQSVTKTKNINLIETFLSKRLDLIDINKQDFEGNTVIHNLLNCQNLNRLSVILTIDLISKIGILNPYVKNKSGQSIISTILATKDYELINKFLLNTLLNNDDINRQDDYGNTTIHNLMFNCQKDNMEEIKAVTDIIERLTLTYFGDKTNDKNLYCPIRCTFKNSFLNSNPQWIKPFLKNNQGLSVVKAAILTKNISLIHIFFANTLSENDVNFIDDRYTIIDHILSISGTDIPFEEIINIIEYLTLKGLNPFLKNVDDVTIIEKIISTKCWKLVENFIKHTKDEYNFSSFQDKSNNTIIHILFKYCSEDYKNITEILLHSKIIQIDPFTINLQDKTCLEIIILTKNWYIIKLYILKTINKHNINKQTKSGDTFLTLLLKNYTDNFDHITGLLEDLKDYKIKLFTQISPTTTILQSVLSTQHWNLIIFFVLNNVTEENINDQDSHGNTLIHNLTSTYCETKKVVYILEELRKFKIDPHKTNTLGKTAYKHVLRTHSPNIINTFIRIAFTKDNVNYQNQNGNTILHALLKISTRDYSSDEMKKTLELLLKLKPDTIIENKYQDNPSTVALRSDNFEISKILTPLVRKNSVANLRKRFLH